MWDALRVEELTEDALPAYLVGRDVVPSDVPLEVVALSGGISNDVWRVRWHGGGDGIVVKQALPLLRVADEWAYDVGRSDVERRALEAVAALVGSDAVPAVVFADAERPVIGMTCAPDGGIPWKDLLLDGRIAMSDAYRAGDLLGRIHAASAADPALAETFADRTTLIEGRVDPYHRTTAARHPDLAPIIEAEIERLLATRSALVLGDYAPKNLLVYPDRVVVLDLEVAHWGDPAFDIAFCLNHLCIKALHLPRQRALLAGAARMLRNAYGEQAPIDEPAVVAELGVLMLARVDGKSPAEYLDEQSRDRVRRMARSLLLDPPVDAMAAIDRVEVGA